MTRAILAYLILSLALGGFGVPRIGFGALPPQETGVSVTVQFDGGETPSPTPTQGIFPYPFLPPPLGSIVLRGFASPESFLSILKDDRVVATTRTDEDGTFEIILSSISATAYKLGLFAEDPEGNLSETITFPSVPVFRDATTTIEQIFVPSTFILDTPQVDRGEDITLHGYTVPGASVIALFRPTNIMKRTEADQKGYWRVRVSADEFSKGVHEVRIRTQLSSGLLSEFSSARQILVGLALPGLPEGPPGQIPPGGIPPGGLPPGALRADFNNDGTVDLIDLSILLYNWGIPKNAQTDLNNDGTVDLIDFSILLFFWIR